MSAAQIVDCPEVLTECFLARSAFGRHECFVADLFAGSVACDRLGESAAGELGAVEGVEDEASVGLMLVWLPSAKRSSTVVTSGRTSPSQIAVGPPPESRIAE